MFTDISGFSAIMQADESHARTILERHRQVIEETHKRYQGEILQYFGDGTLSVFDSAVSAVECAVDIQIDLRKEPEVPLRIGIHTGDISWDENGAFGDGVNVASRVENLCEKGAVYLTAKVYDDIKNHPWLKAVNLGSFNLRNIQQPMVVYAVSSKGLPVPSHRMEVLETRENDPVLLEVEDEEVYEVSEAEFVPPIGLKSKVTAALLAFFLGVFGVHKFYLGKRGAGILRFVLFVISMAITVDEGFPMIAIFSVAMFIEAILLAVMPQAEFDAKYNSGQLVKKRVKAKQRPVKQTRKDPIENLLDKGLQKFKSKKYQQAIDFFDHILDFDPNHAESHYYLACSYSKVRDKDEALYHLKEAVNLGFVTEKEILREPTLRYARSQKEYPQIYMKSVKPAALPQPKQDLLDSEPFDPMVLDKIELLGEKLYRGELSQQEFQKEKEKILRGNN